MLSEISCLCDDVSAPFAEPAATSSGAKISTIRVGGLQRRQVGAQLLGGRARFKHTHIQARLHFLRPNNSHHICLPYLFALQSRRKREAIVIVDAHGMSVVGAFGGCAVDIFT